MKNHDNTLDDELIEKEYQSRRVNLK